MLPPFSQIEKEITKNIALADLERRLKPKEVSNDWIDASIGGFLAPSEHLFDVMKADYEFLEKNKISYEHMAATAQQVLTQVSRESLLAGKMSSFMARYINPNIEYDQNRFKLTPVTSFGLQSCPWRCVGKDKFGYATRGSSTLYIFDRNKEHSAAERIEWKKELGRVMKLPKEQQEEYMARCKKSLGMEFGGQDRLLYVSAFMVIADLTPHLIASHYFFEGNASYRTDPAKLLEFAHSGK